MKVWIIGSQGLLGDALVEFCPEKFIATSRLELDITNQGLIEKFLDDHSEITHIINASAFSLVDLAEKEKSKAFLVNAIAPMYLAKAAKKRDLFFIHISTDYVFDGRGRSPLNELDPVNPLNFYGLSKLEGEKNIQENYPRSLILRTSALFGRKGRNFVAHLMQMLTEKNEFFLTFDQLNSPTYAKDLANVIFKMINHSGLYHFANAGSASKYDIARLMADYMLGKGLIQKAPILHPVPSSYFPPFCERPMFTVFNTNQIQRHLGEIRPWQEALKSFIFEDM